MSRDIKYIGMDVHKEAIVIAVMQAPIRGLTERSGEVFSLDILSHRMSEIDSMTMSAPWTRVNFGGANQPKGPGERSRTMIMIGADYHPAFQQIAFVDTETGELQERRLEQPEGAEKFYRELAAQGKRVRVGM